MTTENKLPESIINLAGLNATVLAILGSNYFHRSWQESQDIGQQYISGLYPDYDQPKIRHNRLDFPATPQEQIRLETAKTITQENNIGLILIRPEMYHIKNNFCEFLIKNGFNIVYEDPRIVDTRTYAALYNSTFDVEAAKPAWPTRTVVYVDSLSYQIIFIDPKNRFESLADSFFTQYKGQEGILQRNTLRGEVVYSEAIKLGFDGLKGEELSLALDPFTALRNIVQLPGKQPHSHLPHNLSLLKYNAVSVHIPNATELTRHLAALNDDYQLKQIYELLSKS